MGRLEEALRLRRLGLSVIPLHSPYMPLQNGGADKDQGKVPLIPWKEFQIRKASEDEIRQWWTQWPQANIGIVTGKVSGVMVLDVDGEEGRESLSQFGSITGSWSAKTGNGFHHYFTFPPEGIVCKTGFLPGLDIRGEGGLCGGSSVSPCVGNSLFLDQWSHRLRSLAHAGVSHRHFEIKNPGQWE